MIVDVFSKRGQPAPDVVVYDRLPEKLRVQVVHILRETLGGDFYLVRLKQVWEWLGNTIAKEHGLLQLPETARYRYADPDLRADCLNYILSAEPKHALDMIELAFRALLTAANDRDFAISVGTTSGAASAAAEELNGRFRENGCGFQFEAGRIVRTDSQLLHAEAVRPALALLSGPGFQGAEGEFLAAHEHHRHGRNEAAIIEACKAFESTMKSICDARKWKYDADKATARTLIKIILDNGLVPSYSDEQLHALERCLLGVATLRNKEAGHGAGAQPRDVPEHYVAYALHMAASNIVFLVKSHQST